jgi:hypothetical protein
VDLTMRFRMAAVRRGSLFALGGGGIQTMVDSPHFPADGSEKNFTLSVGIGALVPVARRLRLSLDVRAFHISNSNVWRNNSGYDGIQVVLSPEWSF